MPLPSSPTFNAKEKTFEFQQIVPPEINGAAIFNKIYNAAINEDKKAIEQLLAEHLSLNILCLCADGPHTPVSKLANEDNHKAVRFLTDCGASRKLAKLAYMQKGNRNKRRVLEEEGVMTKNDDNLKALARGDQLKIVQSIDSEGKWVINIDHKTEVFSGDGGLRYFDLLNDFHQSSFFETAKIILVGYAEGGKVKQFQYLIDLVQSISPAYPFEEQPQEFSNPSFDFRLDCIKAFARAGKPIEEIVTLLGSAEMDKRIGKAAFFVSAIRGYRQTGNTPQVEATKLLLKKQSREDYSDLMPITFAASGRMQALQQELQQWLIERRGAEQENDSAVRVEGNLDEPDPNDKIFMLIRTLFENEEMVALNALIGNELNKQAFSLFESSPSLPGVAIDDLRNYFRKSIFDIKPTLEEWIRYLVQFDEVAFLFMIDAITAVLQVLNTDKSSATYDYSSVYTPEMHVYRLVKVAFDETQALREKPFFWMPESNIFNPNFETFLRTVIPKIKTDIEEGMTVTQAIEWNLNLSLRRFFECLAREESSTSKLAALPVELIFSIFADETISHMTEELSGDRKEYRLAVYKQILDHAKIFDKPDFDAFLQAALREEKLTKKPTCAM